MNRTCLMHMKYSISFGPICRCLGVNFVCIQFECCVFIFVLRRNHIGTINGGSADQSPLFSFSTFDQALNWFLSRSCRFSERLRIIRKRQKSLRSFVNFFIFFLFFLTIYSFFVQLEKTWETFPNRVNHTYVWLKKQKINIIKSLTVRKETKYGKKVSSKEKLLRGVSEVLPCTPKRHGKKISISNESERECLA